MMTPAQLEELRDTAQHILSVSESATPGPWDNAICELREMASTTRIAGRGPAHPLARGASFAEVHKVATADQVFINDLRTAGPELAAKVLVLIEDHLKLQAHVDSLHDQLDDVATRFPV